MNERGEGTKREREMGGGGGGEERGIVRIWPEWMLEG